MNSLPVALLFLFNMARGGAYIKHWQWLVLAFWCGCIMPGLGIVESLAFMWIVLVTTILTTRPLLDGINGDPKAIWNGLIRNIDILPALYILGSWFGLIMLGQGLLYYVMGRITKKDPTRKAEGITGAILGLI